MEEIRKNIDRLIMRSQSLNPYLRPHNPGEGHFATIDATYESSHHKHINPHASENVPFFSTKHSTTHSRTP